MWAGFPSLVLCQISSPHLSSLSWAILGFLTMFSLDCNSFRFSFLSIGLALVRGLEVGSKQSGLSLVLVFLIYWAVDDLPLGIPASGQCANYITYPLVSAHAATELMSLSHPPHVPKRLFSGDYWEMEGTSSALGADYSIAASCWCLWKVISSNVERCSGMPPSDLVSIGCLRVTKKAYRRGDQNVLLSVQFVWSCHR